MTAPGGVPNLPMGAFTIDTLADKLHDMTPAGMRGRVVERMPSIFDSSLGGNPASDFSFFGIMTQLWAGFNSAVANADPASVTGPEDLPGLLIDFIEDLPVIGEFIELVKSIIDGTFDVGDVLPAIETAFTELGLMLGLTVPEFDATALLVGLAELFGMPPAVVDAIRRLLELVSSVSGVPTIAEIEAGWADLGAAVSEAFDDWLDDTVTGFQGLLNALKGGSGGTITDAGNRLSQLFGLNTIGVARGSNFATDGGITRTDLNYVGCSTSTEQAHSGTRSLKLISAATYWAANTYAYPVCDESGLVSTPMRLGDRFYVEAYVRGHASNTQTVYTGSGLEFGADFFDVSNSFVGGTNALTQATTTALNGVWTKISGYFAAGSAGVHHGNIYIRLGTGVTSGETYYVDDIVIREVTEAQNLINQLFGGSTILSTITAGNIPDVTKSMSADLQATIDAVYQAINGGSSTGNTTASVKDALIAIPHANVGGLLGPTQIGESLQATVDAWFQGFVGSSAVGNGLAALQNIGQEIASRLTALETEVNSSSSSTLPNTTSYTTAGSYTYTIPGWANKLDIIVLGGGGGGQSSNFFQSGNGGLGGTWSSATAVDLGTTIPGSTTTLSVTVGAGGASTSNGGASSVSGTGYAGISGGGGPGTSGRGGSRNGGSPGNSTVNSIIYYCGTTETTAGGTGNMPGGGGAGGGLPGSNPAGTGAPGAVWIRAYV